MHFAHCYCADPQGLKAELERMEAASQQSGPFFLGALGPSPSPRFSVRGEFATAPEFPSQGKVGLPPF